MPAFSQSQQTHSKLLNLVLKTYVATVLPPPIRRCRSRSRSMVSTWSVRVRSASLKTLQARDKTLSVFIASNPRAWSNDKKAWKAF